MVDPDRAASAVRTAPRTPGRPAHRARRSAPTPAQALVAALGAICLGTGGLIAATDTGTAVAGPDVGLLAPVAAPAPVAGRPAAAGTDPATVELPAAGVRAPVVPVGVRPDGLLDVPDPPRTVGWWRDGPAAGATSGTTVLAGHVDSASGGVGAFAALWHARAGDRVVLTGADGSVLHYRVQARRSYLKRDLPPEVFDRSGPARLVLITCGGRFDPSHRSYTDNIVVYATPVAG